MSATTTPQPVGFSHVIRQSQKHILTAPAWPYANGPRHIGHVSGFGLPSDMFSRYQRMAGNKVLMVSGTDEHGTPIQVQADKEGLSTREVADRYNGIIGQDLANLDMSYDLFTRTTTLNHYAVVQEMFTTLLRNGYIFPKTTLGAISPSTGRTLPDRYIEGTCPICGYPSARGDQCDNCGNQLDPIDLINPTSRINGETPVFVDQEHYFLDLPAFADALGSWLQSKSGQWRPNVLKFSLNLLDDLQPRAITRDLDWGVPVPLDGWRDRNDKRIYVWFDAVIGYLSASIEWARRSGDPDAWRAWWNDENAEAYYFMGKDNIVFHSEIWPAMLLGYDGQRGQGRQPRAARKTGSAFRGGEQRVPDDGGPQVLVLAPGGDLRAGLPRPVRRGRAALLRGGGRARRPRTPTSPGASSSAATTTNWSLPGETWSIGRYRSRPGTSARSRPRARSPTPTTRCSPPPAARSTTVGEFLSHSRFKFGVNEAMRVVGEANKYFSEQAPWKLRESDPERMQTILHVTLQAVADAKTLLTPFLPRSSQAVNEMLGGAGDWSGMPRIETVDEEGGPSYPVITGSYDSSFRWESRPIAAGTPLAVPAPLFKKLDQSVVDEEIARLQGDE